MPIIAGPGEAWSNAWVLKSDFSLIIDILWDSIIKKRDFKDLEEKFKA